MLQAQTTVITFHASVAKAQGGKYRPMVQLRADKGRMVGSKTAINTYTTKDAARNAAREACHVALANLAREYPGFMARVA